MKKKILWNDIRANKLPAFSTWIFMAVSAFLFGVTCLLFVNLTGAIDALMEKAKTPDFLQMHAGKLDAREISVFAENNKLVLDYQILDFLNLDNNTLTLDGHSLAESSQDNGVSVQSSKFDFLLDLDNRIIRVEKGEIYVPVCYREEYGLTAGSAMQVGEETFTVAGFLRDSQMNSMMASSKRFLVHPADYERLKALGSGEHLIEFLLRDGADENQFAAEYADAGMPANGPAVTKPLIRMMDAISDALLILVIFIVSAVMLLISMLCIRFTLLARLEEEKKEIGLLKAVGIGRRDIRQIYFLKYLALSAAGGAAGLFAASIAKRPLAAGMQELYGTAGNGMLSFLAAAVGAGVTEVILLLSISGTLRRMERLSVVEALNGQQKDEKKRLISPLYVLITFVISAGVFLMTVPWNLQSTISSPRFVNYMGIGDGDIRLDIRQTDDILEKTGQVEELLAADHGVSSYAALLTKTYRVVLPDGTNTNLNVELGDHAAAPPAYVSGSAPAEKNEIALSYLYAEECSLEIGAQMVLEVNGERRDYTVCGIYSDITNGGKTAKALFIEDDAPIMWSVVYISLADPASAGQWNAELESLLSEKGIPASSVRIRDYVDATYGPTISQIRLAGKLAVTAASVVIFLVVFLFTRLLTAKDRNEISLRKAIGFTGREIRKIYGIRYLGVVCAGIVSGILAGNLLGEKIAGFMLRQMGAAGFQFIIDAQAVYAGIPIIIFVIVFFAALRGLGKIRNISAYECCAGKE